MKIRQYFDKILLLFQLLNLLITAGIVNVNQKKIQIPIGRLESGIFDIGI